MEKTAHNRFLDKLGRFKMMLSKSGVTPPYAFHVQKGDEKDFLEWLRWMEDNTTILEGKGITLRDRFGLPKEHIKNYPDAICMVMDVIICKEGYNA